MYNFIFKLDSTVNFKKEDWIYLNKSAVPVKLTCQEMINIKFGIKYKKCQFDEEIRQITIIIDDKLYYDKTIKLK